MNKVYRKISLSDLSEIEINDPRTNSESPVTDFEMFDTLDDMMMNVVSGANEVTLNVDTDEYGIEGTSMIIVAFTRACITLSVDAYVTYNNADSKQNVIRIVNVYTDMDEIVGSTERVNIGVHLKNKNSTSALRF